MPTLQRVVARYPVAAYFILSFVVSWGAVLWVIAPFSGAAAVNAQDNPLFPLVFVAMLAGPSLSSLLLTGLIDGVAGYRRLGTRLCRWPAGGWWLVVALGAAPLIAMMVTLLLSGMSDQFRPGILGADDKRSVLLFGLTVAALAGAFEELGWTGFAIPRLATRHGVVATGLFVGLLWSAWHVLAIVWGIGERVGTVPLAVFVIVDGLGMLPAFRVLMVWVYNRTASVLVAMLMHASLTATALIITPHITGVFLLVYGLAFAASVWLLVGFLFVISGRRMAWRPPTSWLNSRQSRMTGVGWR